MIAAIYARKSTDQNLPDAEKSITRQIAHATAYAARKGWTVDPAHVYQDDGISGAEFERRAGLTALLAALRPRPAFDVVIMAEPSRLGREQIETAYTLKRITDAGVAVWYYLDDRRAAMDSALAKVMASLSGFASESEREQARARTYDAFARKAKAGHVDGGLVYGYENVRLDGHVERRILEPEAAAVRRIFDLYASGTGLRTIAKTLTAEGAPPPTPRQRDRLPGWGPAALREILRRELYRGEVVWNRRKKTDRAGRTKVRVIRPETDLVRVADERAPHRR
jgi:site-specific DNA recombinase